MPLKYIPYFPNTVEGQAILNNFIRTRSALQYRDNDKVFTKLKRGMPYYEVEKIESIGDNSKNMLIRGECISACAYLKEKGIKVDLVYIDPPFASGAEYAKKVFIRKNPKVVTAIKEAEEEMEIDDLKAFEEKMYGDIWNKETYLNWLYENLVSIKSVMDDNASIYLHLDWHIGHYIKVLMDEIFGEDNFVNEIVWRRKQATSYAKKQFGVTNDTLFWYCKNNEDYIFNAEFTLEDENTQNYIKERFIFDDNDGRGLYMKSPLVNSLYRPNLKYDFIGIKPPENGWLYKKEKLQKLYNNNELSMPKSGEGRISRKIYLKGYKGQVIQNIWIDIPIVNPMAIERIDYATQKPKALLKRIVSSSSNELKNNNSKDKMIIADFFGGSGVTAKVAHDLKRNFIHVDVGINSIQITRDELISEGAEFDILEIKDGVNLFRNPIQTMDKLKKMIIGLRNENKLDKFWEGAIQDSKLGTVPVYLPNLLDHTTKVLDISLMNRVINEAIPDLPDDIKKVIVYYIDIDDKKELEKFIREAKTLVNIELRDLKEILDDFIVDDIVEYKLKEKKAQYEIEITKFISDRLNQKIDEYNQKGFLQPLISNDKENEEDENEKKKKKFTPIEISKEGLELIELISLDCKNNNGKVWHSDKEVKIDKLGYLIEDGNKTKKFWDAKIITSQKPLRMKIRNIAGDELILSLSTDNIIVKKSKSSRKRKD